MRKVRIACLPVAGIENPYQYLMIKGLNSDSRLYAFNGVHNKFFGIILTAIKYKPDYIHFDWESSYYRRRHHWFTLVSIPLFILQILIIKYLFRVILVWTPHNIVPHDINHIKIHRLVRKSFAKQMNKIRLFSDLSIDAAAKEFNISPKKFVVIPEGSYMDYYPNTTNKLESINKLNLPEGKIILLYLGYIKPYKGVDQLINAFYKELDERFHLVLAGRVIDQAFFKKVKSEIKDRITIMDHFIPDNDLQYFYHAADVVVLPFKKIENSGSAILAMGFAKAIIAPSEGVLPDRLYQQKNLLYSNNISEGLQKLYQVTENYLYLCGEKNKESLKQSSWKDFAPTFINK